MLRVPEPQGIYRFMANGMTAYNGVAATEDRATVGTDPSAVAGPYGTGGIPRGAACCVVAGGQHAINPERSESSGLTPATKPRPLAPQDPICTSLTTGQQAVHFSATSPFLASSPPNGTIPDPWC